jgi:hypothetical protein
LGSPVICWGIDFTSCVFASLPSAGPPALCFPSFSSVTCGRAAFGMDAPGDMTPARVTGALRMSAICWRAVFAGMIVLPSVPLERRLRGIACHEMISPNLGPTGDFGARPRICGLRRF